jgi:hypothetical protein
MAEGGREGRGGCLRTGCFGCLAVVGMGVLVVVLLFAIALLLGRPEQRMESPGVAHELPGAPVGDPITDVGDRTLPHELRPDSAAAGRIVLDVTLCQFEVVPGEAGDPIRVEGRYDAGSYELVESLLPEGDEGWEYRLQFGRKVSWIRSLLGEDASMNEIRLVVPRGVPLALEGQIGIGESDLELGGLWLTSTELRLRIGDHSIGFDSPTPEPMESFRIVGSMGETKVRKLGNASPGEVYASNRVGALSLDLEGEWSGELRDRRVPAEASGRRLHRHRRRGHRHRRAVDAGRPRCAAARGADVDTHGTRAPGRGFHPSVGRSGPSTKRRDPACACAMVDRTPPGPSPSRVLLRGKRILPTHLDPIGAVRLSI